MFKASRSAQQGPSPLLCLVTVPSTPLVSVSELHLCVCMLWKKNPLKFLVVSRTTVEIYAGEQQEGCEVHVLSLVSVYPPALFVLTHRQLLVGKDCRLTKCSDIQVILFLSPPLPHVHICMCVSVVDVVWMLRVPYLSRWSSGNRFSPFVSSHEFLVFSRTELQL